MKTNGCSDSTLTLFTSSSIGLGGNSLYIESQYYKSCIKESLYIKTQKSQPVWFNWIKIAAIKLRQDQHKYMLFTIYFKMFKRNISSKR